MRYVGYEEFTKTMVHNELVSLTEGKDGSVNVEILESVNADACAEVDGYLRGIYSLPLVEPTDRNVTSITASIMKFLLFKRCDERTIPDKIIESYKLTISKLKDIQARKIVLDAYSTNGEESVSKASIQSWTPTQKFANHFTKLF